MPEHWGRVKRFGLAVQVLRGKVKSQEGRERREGIEVQVSTGYLLPGGFNNIFRDALKKKLGEIAKGGH